ncbi:hypothetical protein GE061_019291 [Apolygus lucorum]|uniref:Uncharacterized protein n=1 Tax=Apolygus lucorum TaxID=248454 RepID=A0A8S9X9E7_APOLU|nr:hypothetical protein GE061_019291 [Apolygus lucorum]
MSPVLVLFVSVGFVHSFPAIPTYNQNDAASGYYNQWQYNRVNQNPFFRNGAIQSQIPPNGYNGYGTQRALQANSGFNNYQGTNAAQKQPLVIEGARSNAGNSGSIHLSGF